MIRRDVWGGIRGGALRRHGGRSPATDGSHCPEEERTGSVLVSPGQVGVE
jgi:hypothetical protein